MGLGKNIEKVLTKSVNISLEKLSNLKYCLVAEPDKVLVGELKEWVANPLGPDQIKTRSAKLFNVYL